MVHPSSHMNPLEFEPCTKEGSIVKESPISIVPGSLLSTINGHFIELTSRAYRYAESRVSGGMPDLFHDL